MSNLVQVGVDAGAWAKQICSHVDLPDHRHRLRLIKMVAGVANQPGGCVTHVFSTDKERQGAYAFLENPVIEPARILEGLGRATAVESALLGLSSVTVSIDGSSIVTTDRAGTKGTGNVGTRKSKARGHHVMSAIALTTEGVPLGLCDQVYWSRHTSKKQKKNADAKRKRPVCATETQHWLTAMHRVVGYFDEANDGREVPTRPHFVMDRGADCREVLRVAAAIQDRADTTVRSSTNRRIDDPEFQYLHTALRGAPSRFNYTLDVPAGHRRSARLADMEVRTRTVIVSLRDRRSGRREKVTFNALWTSEVGTTPKGEKPIEWFLLTTKSLDSASQVMSVIQAYAHRWRVEEFHRAWKSGVCEVERSQLRSGFAIQKWASILAVVAIRAVRLAYESRYNPSASALISLSEDEIDAIILAVQPRGARLGDRPTIGEAVNWLAQIGGYTGKSSGGPPGPTVIARGLRQLRLAVRVLVNLRKIQRESDL